MNAKDDSAVDRDYRDTIFLPKTDFPMRAGLPKREPEILEHWQKSKLYERLRKDAKGREKFVLHDGPPYANGNIHIGTGLNKILKDVIVRSQQMMGKDANYVPGWDCHGLPIEWKIEEQYRARGKNKDDVPVNEFRRECREFADKWIDIQREEFKRLGIEGDWDKPYTTMAFDAEATIAKELMKFAMNGTLYRGSKPVMWSVVERTALAEAEVEYHEISSPTIWVKFPIQFVQRDGPKLRPELLSASVVIWTTTPWTIPGNRAISYSTNINYGLYEVTSAENEFGPQPGEKYLLATSLADQCAEQAKLTVRQIGDVSADELRGIGCRHPLSKLGYDFSVPLLAGDHVTDDTGTGFVHTAPGHGRDDYDAWIANKLGLESLSDTGNWINSVTKESAGLIDTDIPYTVDEAGFFTKDAPGFEGKVVINDKGKFGDANDAVIEALIKANALFARGRLKHDYPHSWRSKKPIIFRNTPQWFIAMDKDIQEAGSAAGTTGNAKNVEGDSLRARALKAISETRWVPAAGENRITGMINTKPDWVISRQRAWGVPITVFRNTKHNSDSYDDIVPSKDYPWSGELITRITKAFESEGADAWFADGAKQRFLEGLVDNLDDWEMVTDILDVWFDSGSTHNFVCDPELNKGKWDLKWPASLYLEGSDQHRGWFQSSLLESCGTRGRAPYEAVLTHGFVMAEDGRKMSKSLNNQVFPQDVIKQNGADILRLWVMSSDYAEDLRIGPEIIKSNVDAYRKIRNTMRFLLGNLRDFDEAENVDIEDMPELERYMLHRLAKLDELVREQYNAFDFKRIFAAIFNFAIMDLSAFYFDIRKDSLYCDQPDSTTRRACRTVLDEVFKCLTAWLAPVLCYTMEEVWLQRFPSRDGSVHLRQFPEVAESWRHQALADKWQKIRTLRKVVTGALEIERREKRIGSSLEADAKVYVNDASYLQAYEGLDPAEIFITSQATIVQGTAPDGAFSLSEVDGVGVVPDLARGAKCARSWKILAEVGTDPEFPDLTIRDANAVRAFDRRMKNST